MLNENLCPYAIRQWSSVYQWIPGCSDAKTLSCTANPDCALRVQEERREAKTSEVCGGGKR